MKTDPKKIPPNERLLADIYAEDFDTAEHCARDRNLLLREFRLAYWRRKTTRVLLAAAAVVALAIFTSFYSRNTETDAPTQTAALPARPIPAPQRSTLPSETAKADYLSDEELLKLFPPDSCFLAELNGKQVLVFKDPNLAAAVLH